MPGAIFDLDGTLLNTLDDIGSACNRMLTAQGYPQHPLPAYASMVGNGFARTVELALPSSVWAQLSKSEREALVMEARAHYATHLLEHTLPYPGMEEALCTLARSGLVLAVLSNKPHDWTVELIRHFFPSITFALIVGARPDAPLKPNPYVPLEMLSQLGLESSSCAYVGDSDVDMQTAINSGMIPVGAAWGFRGEAELRQSGARFIASSPAELPEILCIATQKRG